MELLQNTKDVPSRSTLIVWGEFLELTGTTPDRLSELMDIGWLKPTRTAEAALLFRQDDVYASLSGCAAISNCTRSAAP